MTAGMVAKPDAWLGSILGRPAFNVMPSENGADPTLRQRLSEERLFATAKIPVSEVAGAEALEDLGFRVVDVALKFKAAAGKVAADTAVARFSRPEDREAVVAVAGNSFRYSRFHQDPHIPDTIANSLKSAWAGNYFSDARGDAMIVAEADGGPAGFLQLLWADDDCLVIDLIAVSQPNRGRGLAKAMIHLAAAKGTGDGRVPGNLLVGTQAANGASVQLYENLGFRLAGAQLVLHHHGTDRHYPLDGVPA